MTIFDIVEVSCATSYFYKSLYKIESGVLYLKSGVLSNIRRAVLRSRALAHLGARESLEGREPIDEPAISGEPIVGWQFSTRAWPWRKAEQSNSVSLQPTGGCCEQAAKASMRHR